MKTTKLLFAFAINLSFVYLNSSNAQSLKWAKQFDSQNYTASSDYGYAVTVDPSTHDIYVTGGIDQNASSQNAKIVTIKYNSAGTQQWTTTTDGGSNGNVGDREYGACIALDGSGNVWVAATYYNGSTYHDDLALFKYNASTGAVASGYPKTINDVSSGLSPGGKCLAVYNSSNVYIGGSTWDGTKWEGVVCKDSSGGPGWAWTRKFSGSSTSSANSASASDLKADASNVYVTGFVSNTSQLTDCYTTVLTTTSGTVKSGWPKTYSSTDNDAGNALIIQTVSPSIYIYVAGYTYSGSTLRNGLLIKYDQSGTQSWATTYNNSTYNKYEEFTDIAGIGSACSGNLIYVSGYMEKDNNPSTYDADYLLAAFSTSTGSLSCWGTNPVFYDGAAASPEPLFSDRAYAIEYSSSSGKLYVSGKSYEVVGLQNSLNITTRCYNSTNGSLVWSNSYDYGTDNIVSTDEMTLKYGLTTSYYDDACHTADRIYVEGESYKQHTLPQVASFDYNTLMYGPSGPCTDSFDSRLASSDEMAIDKSILFPNPLQQSSILHISTNIKVKDARLAIYDCNGNLVKLVNEVNSNDIPLGCLSLTNGLYFYMFTSQSEIIISGKILVYE